MYDEDTVRREREAVGEDQPLHEMSGRVLEPEQLEVGCTHDNVVAYEHEGECMVGCRICGKEMKITDWVRIREEQS